MFILTILAALKSAKWASWRSYLPTIYYFSFGNVLYQYFAFQEKPLWILTKPFVSQTITDLTYTLIIYPCIILLFIGNGPQRQWTKQFIHLFKWIFIFALFEWIALKYGYITYYNGWNFWWSVLFLFIMFPMLKIHHNKTAIALILSPFIIVFYLIAFQYQLW